MDAGKEYRSGEKGGSKESGKSGSQKQSKNKKQSKKQSKKQNTKQNTNQSTNQPTSNGRTGSSGSGLTARTGSSGGLSRRALSESIRPSKARQNVPARATSGSGIFKLSDDLKDQLKGLTKEEKVELPAQEDTTKLKMKDDREETKRSEHVRALLAALACAGIIGAGAAWEEISFRLRLKRRTVRVKRRSAAV